MTIAVASLAIGAALGLRFRIYVLLPATAVACVIVAAQGHGHGAVAIMRQLILVSALMQLGYLIGVLSSALLHVLLLHLTHPYADATRDAQDAQR